MCGVCLVSCVGVQGFVDSNRQTNEHWVIIILFSLSLIWLRSQKRRGSSSGGHDLEAEELEHVLGVGEIVVIEPIVNTEVNGALLDGGAILAVVVLLAVVPALLVGLPGAVAASKAGLREREREKASIRMRKASEEKKKPKRSNLSYHVGSIVFGDGGESEEAVSVVGDDGVDLSVDLEDPDGGVEPIEVIIALSLEDDSSRSTGRGGEHIGGLANQALGHEATVGISGGEDLVVVDAGPLLDVGDEGPGEAKVVNVQGGGGGAAGAGVPGAADTSGVNNNVVCGG